eukprot:gb/GECG01005552.1/.p1 GENE.gb/GECG01005552.1/~~gb/GECG01005552.1/.p1  ORF type:complete len:1139 (+),score=187.64 gb/GECG01005552.1/:1-3417(+)
MIRGGGTQSASNTSMQTPHTHRSRPNSQSRSRSTSAKHPRRQRPPSAGSSKRSTSNKRQPQIAQQAHNTSISSHTSHNNSGANINNTNMSVGDSSTGVTGEEEEVIVPSNTEGRVKVAVRCRPPFEDELEEGPLIVEIPEPAQQNPSSEENEDEKNENGEEQQNPTVSSGEVDVLTNEKKKRFVYDRAFSSTSSQDDVYNEVGGPIVADVMAGYNGSILAYGQTGTGKTYTMGILNRVTGAHTGIIPRGLSHVFGHIAQEPHKEWSVSMSFVQIYLETVQDLFSASLATSKLPQEIANRNKSNAAKNAERSAFGGPGMGKAGRDKERLRATLADDSLQVREDPKKGFFVEGLSEYTVNNYEEAIELLNWGLENRVMGYTKMNATSSRSHTLLTVRVFQKEYIDFNGRPTPRKLSGKLMFVDLAGSERVRRTESQGSRLVEARSINQSLSALGNVIAALADRKTSHIPFRDSKLTRLLQGCLGGGASTYLIATIGPSVVNESETLSTLTFASRCMSVQSSPVLNEEVDYAVLCARLQARISDMESDFLKRENNIRQLYERRINDLLEQIEQMSKKLSEASAEQAKSDSSTEHADSSKGGNWTPVATDNKGALRAVAKELGVHEQMLNIAEWGNAYHNAIRMYDAIVSLFAQNSKNEGETSKNWQKMANEQRRSDQRGMEESAAMARNDPLGGPEQFGPHLPKQYTHETLKSVHNRFGSNNDSRDSSSEQSLLTHPTTVQSFQQSHPNFSSFQSAAEVRDYIRSLYNNASKLTGMVNTVFENKDGAFNDVKKQLAMVETQQRQREEELTNQSFVLKHLVDMNATLRDQNLTLEHNVKQLQEKALEEERQRQQLQNNSTMALNQTALQSQPSTHEDSQEYLQRPESPSRDHQHHPQQHRDRDYSAFSPPIDDPVKFRKMEERQKQRHPDWPSADEAPATMTPQVSAPETRGGHHSSGHTYQDGSASMNGGPRGPGSSQQPVQKDSRERISLREPATDTQAVPNGHVAHNTQEARNGDTDATAAQYHQQQHGYVEDLEHDVEEDVVEKIVDKRVHEGQVLYKVHWKNTDPAEDEWFMAEDLMNDFPEVVEEFETSGGGGRRTTKYNFEEEDDEGSASVHSGASSLETAELEDFETYASRMSK